MATSQPSFAWTPELLVHYPRLAELDLSSDGSQLAYGLSEPVLTEEESKYVTHLYRLATAGGEPLRLTYGTANNTAPRWSPDGRYIAFLSDRKEGKPNLYVMRADGGEPWPLTEAEKGVQAFAWSRDGSRLVLVMAAPDSAEKKAAKKAKNDPVRVDVDLEYAQLWVIPFGPGGGKLPEPQALTVADRHVMSVDWTEDSGALAFTYQPHPSADDWVETKLAVVEAAPQPSGQAPVIRELGKPAAGGICAVHGGWVACVTSVEPVTWSGGACVVLYPLAGGEPHPLTMTAEANPWLLGWSADGNWVYILEAEGTGMALRALSVAGGAPRTLVEGRGVFWPKANERDQFALIADGFSRSNYLAFMHAEETAWREVYQPPLPAGWPLAAQHPRSEVLRWKSTDGLEIEGIVSYLPGYEPGKRYPTLLIVHGGPAGAFTARYDGEPSLYPITAFAERGYITLRPNPRGSMGYGEPFRAANKRDWGYGDFQDCMTGLDALIERGVADPERLGIMGWSYGGYMTSWAITQTRRFRAASVGAGVTNLMSFSGTSDIHGFLPDYFQAEFWNDPEAYRAHSALFNVKGATTPTLIQHGEADVRVPLGQGQELYNALKRQGVTVEMDIYPRAGHGPSEPRQIMDVMQRNLDWFDRWLK